MEKVEVLEVPKKDKIKKNWFKELLPYIIIVLAVVLLRTFIITPIQVDGSSMYPTLEDRELLILKKYDKSFDRFDIVVFDCNGSRLIKRVVGLPGERIEYRDNKLYIDGKVINEDFDKNSKTEDFILDDIGVDIIPKGYYFVMGDNRDNSTDSRIIGLVSEKDIKGSTNLSIFPFDKIGTIN
ncbi:MAG: signal peptidase I [Bacilli bacterium]|nr:signal peptidase I [Bacilli bacterium]